MNVFQFKEFIGRYYPGNCRCPGYPCYHLDNWINMMVRFRYQLLSESEVKLITLFDFE